MEYIKKEELIEGEIYNATISNDGSEYIFKPTENFYSCININKKYGNHLYRNGNFCRDIFKFSQATPEEKHWLNECITADKFITFEEAMETFIPEYVEVLDTGCRITGTISSGKIYKCSKDVTKTYHYGFFLDSKHRIGFNKNEFDQYLKPSTKEAYDAQFVVKEEEFVLPENWGVKCNSSNYKPVKEWAGYDWWKDDFNRFMTHNKTWLYANNGSYTEITFEQFKKYVLKEETAIEFGNKIDKEIIEPLPQFKIIETIETITKVENNEGNQFFIGDKVITPLNNNIIIISSFTYNQDKTELYANFKETLDVININKIEHYIEPKTDYKILEYKTEGGISCKAPFLADSHQFYINERCKIYSIKRISDDLIITVGDEVLGKTCGVPNKILSIELINNKIRLYPRNSFYNLEDIIKVKDETLLEKAKRLYPIGTKFKVACNPKYTATVKDHNDYPFQDIDIVNLNTEENIDGYTGMTVFYKGKWAEIINE